jgi:glycosyltransferase involved in cell wall biosynthesis
MRIAFVNTLYPPHGASGAETTLRFLAKQLSERGHDCSVITLTPERTGSAGEIDGIPVRYLPLANVYWPHGGRRPAPLRPIFQGLDAFNPVMERRLSHVLREMRPQVVNAHNLQGFSVAAWRAAKRLGIPLVQTLHDYYAACPRSAMWRPGRGNCERQCPECRVFSVPRRAASSLPTAVTAVSHRMFDRIAATGMFPAAREGRQPVRIIRGNNPAPGLPPLPPGRDDGPWRFGFMGRLDPAKGLEGLIEAFAGLPAGCATLAIAGDGPDPYACTLRSHSAGQAGVRFLGQVKPASFFEQIDILVIPSVWEDPFPRVFHEALAYGIPSLVTPLGGLPEAIEHGRTGIIAAATTPAALRDAMLRLVAGAWDFEAMRTRCRIAAGDYEPTRIVSQYEAVLAAAAGSGSIGNAGEAWRPARPI